MKPRASLAFLAAVLSLSRCIENSPAPALAVTASTGVLNGFISPSAPSVRQFLGVPYALPPTSSRRWLPPMAFNSSADFIADDIGPACPQLPLRNNWVFSVNGGNMTEFFPVEDFDEDCLTLSIWAPQSQQKDLPVIVWFFGGGFTQGGTNTLYFNPKSWVEQSQEHIVVTVNFRSNIFGFPNAPGLTEQNLGLLDQRAALEWLRDNIAKFGGDPSRLVAWGESAGAIGLDFLNFAFASDPIVSGIILNSGTALFAPDDAAVSHDTNKTNWAFVAKAVGCGQTLSPTEELECMRNVLWQVIEGAYSTNTSLTFIPTVDERIILSNYSSKYAEGRFSPVPAIIGSNRHELNALIPQAPGVRFNSSDYDLVGNATYLCGAAKAAKFRAMAGRTTYRYRYDGVFDNISPPRYPGAFHASDLPLIFGTAGQWHGNSTPYEDIVSKQLQELYVAFANDPENGLQNTGWGTYAQGRAVLLGGALTPVQQVAVSDLDEPCSVIAKLAEEV